MVNTSPLGCVNPANSGDHRNFASNVVQSVSLDDAYGIATQFTYHFDNFDVKYLGGYVWYHYNLQIDNDGGPVSRFSVPFALNGTPANTFTYTTGTTTSHSTIRVVQ